MPKKSVKKKTGKTHKRDEKKIVSNFPTAQLSFENIVDFVSRLHTEFLREATKAVNVSLTLRNWLIGAYVHEYEFHGEDRAKYGENVLSELAKSLCKQGVPGCDYSSLYKYLRFYRLYPQILETLSPELQRLEKRGFAMLSILETSSPKTQKRKTSAEDDLPRHCGQEILEKLSYSHISLLLAIDDPYRRAFYESECMKGNWTFRELKRQISSMYFERASLSTNKTKLQKFLKQRMEVEDPKLIVRDPMVFEFLGLKPSEAMLEEELEQRMLDKLQDLLLELGHGFCFEGRQKRILIDGEYFFVDLVFYHRILRCHVLFELKMSDFRHCTVMVVDFSVAVHGHFVSKRFSRRAD